MADELPELRLSEMLLEGDEERSELDKIFEQLFDPENIAHNTELTRQEITAFSVLGTLADKYDLAVLKQFLVQNLVLRVSKGRAGRKEWVKIITKMTSDEEQAQGRMARLFGRGRNPP